MKSSIRCLENVSCSKGVEVDGLREGELPLTEPMPSVAQVDDGLGGIYVKVVETKPGVNFGAGTYLDLHVTQSYSDRQK